MKISAKVSFERKLLELEKVIDQLKVGRRPENYYPDDITGFRSWKRPDVFDAWVSKNIDAPNGAYPEMAKRLRDLLTELEGYSIKGLQKRIQEMKKLITAMAKQNTEMESIIRELSDKLEMVGKLTQSDRVKIIQLYR
ncbi:MerR family transcriptional regulator [Rhizobium laguerreae]|uniref:hypothetical protein n=1 Tax=Rhizobium laguerreae TaxID=1076926 RepID=UPI001C920AD1|nr:hypothetical protein [Rhizobium laguerreae]MBY3367260.1 hypothetical protein [Rhizobium laguerreae]